MKQHNKMQINNERKKLQIKTVFFDQQSQCQQKGTYIQNELLQLRNRIANVKDKKSQAVMHIENLLKSISIKLQYNSLLKIRQFSMNVKPSNQTQFHGFINNRPFQKLAYQKIQESPNKKKYIFQYLKKDEEEFSMGEYSNQSKLQNHKQLSVEIESIKIGQKFHFKHNQCLHCSLPKTQKTYFQRYESLNRKNTNKKQSETLDNKVKALDEIRKIQKQIVIIKQATDTIQGLALNLKQIYTNKRFQFSDVYDDHLQINTLQLQIQNLKANLRREKAKKSLKGKINDVQSFNAFKGEYGEQVQRYTNIGNQRVNTESSQESSFAFSLNPQKNTNKIKQKIVRSSFEDNEVVDRRVINQKQRLIIQGEQKFQSPPRNSKRFKSQSLQRTFEQSQKLATEPQTQIQLKKNFSPSTQRITTFYRNAQNQVSRRSVLGDSIRVFNGRSIKQRCFGNYKKNVNNPQSISQQKQAFNVSLNGF